MRIQGNRLGTHLEQIMLRGALKTILGWFDGLMFRGCWEAWTACSYHTWPALAFLLMKCAVTTIRH